MSSAEEDQKLMDSLVAIQSAYWQPNPDEKARLLAKPLNSLSWDETLRLHHLACLDLLNTPEGRARWMSEDSLGSGEMPRSEAYLLCQRLAQRLLLKESPYRPRPCEVWQGPPGSAQNRAADMMGLVRNASLTHLGCVEVIHIDGKHGPPTTLSFIPYDDIQVIVFARSALFRAAMIYYDDGRPQEVVWMPLQYGVSWATPNPFDHDASFTRFCCHVEVGYNVPQIGIGIGQQDFELIDLDQKTASLFGLHSPSQFATLLEADDPKLEQKCIARGMDVAEVKRFIAGMGKN